MPDATETFLFGPGECDEPVPTPELVRRYRYFAMVPVEMTADGVPLAPPVTLATMMSRAMNKSAVSAAKTPIELFDGVPLNMATGSAQKSWREPLLAEVEVASLTDLVRRGAVDVDKKAVALRLSPEDQDRLLATGSAVVARQGGGWLRLRLSSPATKSAARQKKSTLSGTGPSAPPPPPQGGTPGTTVPAATLGLLLPFEQVWKLKSYERGELISSIVLTPLEEVTIEVFSWDRRKTSIEDTTSTESERVAEGQAVDRDTRDVFGEITRNSAFNWGLNGSLTAGMPGKFGLQVGGNVGSNTTVNDVARTTRQALQEATVKSTERVKASRQTKITESVEQGSETRTTRKLRNSNQAYALSYNYFALLARYGVSTSCLKSEVALVLQVDAPGGMLVVDYDFLRVNEPALRRRLLDAAFAPGFEAARTLWMYERACAELCRSCECGATSGSATSPRLAAAATAALSLATAVMVVENDATSPDWSGYFDLLVPIVDGTGAHPAVATPTGTAMRHAMFVAALESIQPGLWRRLADACRPLTSSTAAPTPAQVSALQAVIGSLDPALLDRAVNLDQATQDAVTGLVARLIRATYSNRSRSSLVAFFAAGGSGNAQLDDAYRMLLGMLTSESDAAGMMVTFMLLQMTSNFHWSPTNDNGIRPLIQPAKDAAQAWLDEAATEDQAARVAAAAARRERESTVRSLFGPDRMLAARERFDALRGHLLDNNDYYAFQLLTERIAQGRYQPPLAILQYLPYVGTRPIAVVDGKLCFPIVPAGSAALAPILAVLAKLADAIANDDDETDVQLPTPGMVVEPKLSMCSSAEPDAQQAREIELEQRQALAAQARLEAQRREKRLGLATPDLDPFEPPSPAIRVTLDQPEP